MLRQNESSGPLSAGSPSASFSTARLALAQLHQDDIEQACATSGSVFTVMDGAPIPGRGRQLLGDFQRDPTARVPSAHIAHAGMDRYSSEWSPS
ncbi:hypothetical protein ACH47Z_39880 [Streptomyces sp. NPDC020192]|uniref:hypothetical protein n=1 Tax=Streptomyces sp. NPDC020192 TaxID=3365066 RepID=UPI0037B2C68D